jgi:hypothetical protein
LRKARLVSDENSASLRQLYSRLTLRSFNDDSGAAPRAFSDEVDTGSSQKML